MALLAHNQKVFENIVDIYKEKQNMLLVHGTGLGKTFIFLELEETIFKDKKILFIVPQNSTSDNIKEYDTFKAAATDITFKTYNYFSTTDKAVAAADKYDIIVCDEAHHLGSAKYGKNVRTMFEHIKGSDKKLLGMTATQVREDGINVADFFEETLVGVTIFDAIRDGIIPTFEYLVCRDNGSEVAGYDRKEKDYRKVIDYYDSLPLLSETVDRNRRDRWLCFFSNIKELEGYEVMIREMFTDDYTFLKITSKHDTRISDITKYEKTVVLCVDKLLEGVHVPKTSGIILFRNVRSLPVFQQILGRVVHVGDTEHPIILDCTQVAIKMLAKLLKENEKKGTVSTNSTSDRPILFCSLQNAEHFNAERLLALACDSRVWSEEEIAILKEYYPLEGKKVAKRLPNRTPMAIKAMAVKLGITHDTIWSDEENEILAKYYPEEGIKVQKRLPNRSASSIKNQVNKLGLRYNYVHSDAYSEEEDNKVRELYPIYGQNTYKFLPGRSKDSVIRKAVLLGVTKPKAKVFTEDEKQFIKDNIDKGFEYIAEKLGRSRASIRTQAKQIGAYKTRAQEGWKEKATSRLIEMYSAKSFTIAQMAEQLGRTPASVNGRLAQLRRQGLLAG